MPIVRDFTSILSGGSWSGADTTASPAFVTYSFEAVAQPYLTGAGYSGAFMASFAAFSEADRALAHDALGQWAAVCGIVLLEVPAGHGDMRFGKFDASLSPDSDGAAGFAFGPDRPVNFSSSEFKPGGDVFIDIHASNNIGLMLHEIGHALGFNHPFEGPNTLAANLDNTTNTVMSYSGLSPTHLGAFDIAAAQHDYGVLDAANLASWNWDAAALTLTQTGKTGNETIFGVAVKDVIGGGEGNDTLVGFGGNDSIAGGAGNDQLFGGEGADVLTGGTGADVLDGSDSNDILTGGAGNDKLYGGTGADVLTGGTGRDVLGGGLTASRDLFVFDATAQSRPGAANRDVILDFQPGVDKINLTVIDANGAGPGSTAFKLIGAVAFSGHAGELRVERSIGGHGWHNIVSADTNGDRIADFEIDLASFLTPAKVDFML